MKFANVAKILALTKIHLSTENLKRTRAIFRKRVPQGKSPLGNRHHFGYTNKPS